VRRLQTLIAASPLPTRTERIVLACPPGEQHTLSLHVINLFLRRQGWEVIDLGANVPLDRLESMLTNLHPQLLIAAAQHLPTAQTLQAMALTVQRLKIPLAYGGGIFNRLPALRHHIAGHFLGESLGELPATVQTILRAPWPLPETIDTPRDYVVALEHYRERLLLIEAEVLSALEPKIREMVRQVGANAYLTQYLEAALALGDVDFLDSDMSWIRGLLATHQLPDAVLYGFLAIYWTAAQKYLDRRGTIIVEWFRRIVNERKSNQ